MISLTSHLFEPIHLGMLELLEELEAASIRNLFTINKTNLQLILTHNYLVLCENYITQKPSHFLKLQFEVKFEVLYQKFTDDQSLGIPIGIKLERQNCSEQLILSAHHPSIIEAWSIELQKKINQRNFHKLFKAKKKIGKGAFATVYLAERLRDNKMVAVKAFSKEKQYSGEKGRESLQNEVRLMRKLNHWNIMRLEGVYETENSIYVILEYLEGTQLNDLLKSNRRLQESEISTTIQNILKALAHLAAHRIIHRDLKPENIMFRKEGSFDLAICDFGLATEADQEKYLFVRCGTPGFVAPEIINIRDMSTKSHSISDVFSAGVIFHYLLFGHSVFEGKKYNEILAQNRACEFDFSKQCYSQINAKTLDLLMRMLEKDPSKRISSECALEHAYFSAATEMEEEKQIFKDISNREKTNGIEKLMSYELTPTTVSNRPENLFSREDKQREKRIF